MEHTESKRRTCARCYLLFKSEESYKEHKLTCSDRKPIGQLDMETKVGIESDEDELYVCDVSNGV